MDVMKQAGHLLNRLCCRLRRVLTEYLVGQRSPQHRCFLLSKDPKKSASIFMRQSVEDVVYPLGVDFQ